MSKNLFAMAMAALPLLGGCVNSRPDPGVRQVSVQLDRISANLEKISCAIGPPENSALATAQAAAIGNKTPDLSKIKPLSANPDNQEIADYVKAVLTNAPKGKPSFTSPAVEMLRLIGTGHLDILEPYLDNPYVSQILWEAVGAEDLEVGIRLLPKHPELYYSLSRFDPDLRLKKPMREILRDGTRKLNSLRSGIPFYFTTAEDIEFLQKCYVENPYADFLFSVLNAYPDTDMGELTRRTWEERKNDPADVRMKGIENIVVFGNQEALEFMLEQYATNDKYQKSKRKLNRFFSPALDEKMSYQDIRAFYQQNKDRLKYNPKTQKYYIQQGDEK